MCWGWQAIPAAGQIPVDASFPWSHHLAPSQPASGMGSRPSLWPSKLTEITSWETYLHQLARHLGSCRTMQLHKPYNKVLESQGFPLLRWFDSKRSILSSILHRLAPDCSQGAQWISSLAKLAQQNKNSSREKQGKKSGYSPAHWEELFPSKEKGGLWNSWGMLSWEEFRCYVHGHWRNAVK